AGMVADRMQRRRASGRALTMSLGFFATVPFAIAVVFIDDHVPFFICGWLLNFFIPWYNGPMAAIIDDVVDDADAGTAQATFVPFLHLLGTGPAGLALGICSQYLSLRYAFLMPAAALLGSAICATMASRHVASDMAARAERRCARLAA